MNNSDEKNLFELYTLAEISYQNHFKNYYNDIELIYPEGWYKKKNYKTKIEIITEAIKTNKLIIDTLGYQKIIEGIKE